nr:hypothetical protein [uncultured Cohaesibacter sp.]
MTDDKNREIGRGVIGAMMGIVLATIAALIGDLQKAVKQVAFLAIWTSAEGTLNHSRKNTTVRFGLQAEAACHLACHSIRPFWLVSL